MAIKALFKSTIPSMQYFARSGQQCPFINGRFITDNIKIIQELSEEVGEVGAGNSMHPFIYVDEHEREVDTEKQKTIAELMQEARAEGAREAMENIRRATSIVGNVSSSAPGSLQQSLNNSHKIADAMSGSTGANDAAPLINAEGGSPESGAQIPYVEAIGHAQVAQPVEAAKVNTTAGATAGIAARVAATKK